MVRDDRRELERRRRRRRKYGQAKLRHSKRGIISCIMGEIAVAIIAAVLGIAYKNAGNGAAYIGGLGLVAMVLSGTGLWMAVRGLKERNKDYTTCKVGIACNAVFLLGTVIVFCRGLF